MDYVAMVTNFYVITYIQNLYSIKHYLRQLIAKYGASIANIKRLTVLQILDTLDIRANLTAFKHILA